MRSFVHVITASNRKPASRERSVPPRPQRPRTVRGVFGRRHD